jgi:DNA-binding transcriptional LysR family regulator
MNASNHNHNPHREFITPDNVVMSFIDHQAAIMTGVGDMDPRALPQQRYRPGEDRQAVAFDAGLSHLSQARWVRKHVPEERIAIKLDSLVGMVEAVRHGLGIGLLLWMLADNEEDMLRLGEPIGELDTDLLILIHPAVRRVARIKAFTDFLYDRLRH